MSTTADKVRMINEAVAIPRNDFARAKLLKAEIVDGKVLYTAAPEWQDDPGHVIRGSRHVARRGLQGDQSSAVTRCSWRWHGVRGDELRKRIRLPQPPYRRRIPMNIQLAIGQINAERTNGVRRKKRGGKVGARPQRQRAV